MRTGPRILVTDAEHRSVLATCRALGAAGYRVSAVAGERFALGHWSRYSEERIMMEGPQSGPDAYVDRLSRMLRGGAYDLVLPGTELSLLPISERRDLVECHARLGLPPHAVLLDALDKLSLHAHAVATGLAPPPTVVCANDAAARSAAARLSFPLIAKPPRSVVCTAGEVIQRAKGSVVRDPALLEAAVAAIGAPVMLQEYAHGAALLSYAGVRVGQRLLGLTVARYIRTYPAVIGSAALAVTVAPPPRLTQQVAELLDRIGWCGIFELELLSLGEGRFGAIDFNPRPFGWMSLATGAGANLPALWCDHVLGRSSVAADSARAGMYYRWEDADLRNAVAELRRGHILGAAAVLRPRFGTVHGVFELDDPAPLLARMLSTAQKWAA